MPPRLITGAILVFWLAMTGWLIQREVVPAMLAEASPSFMPNLTAEISAPIITWIILRDGDRIGSAHSRFAKDGRDFQFRATFNFNDKMETLQHAEIVDRVTDDGRPVALHYRFV